MPVLCHKHYGCTASGTVVHRLPQSLPVCKDRKSSAEQFMRVPHTYAWIPALMFVTFEYCVVDVMQLQLSLPFDVHCQA